MAHKERSTQEETNRILDRSRNEMQKAVLLTEVVRLRRESETRPQAASKKSHRGSGSPAKGRKKH